MTRNRWRGRVAAGLAAATLLVTAVGAPAASAQTQAEAATSSNWAGYVATGSTFSSVSGSWVVPRAKSSSEGYSATWVGLGGASDSSSALEQVGTESDYVDGEATYSAWYELVPKAPVTMKLTVSPGDHVTAKVTVSGTTVKVSMSDTTTGRTVTKTLHMSDPDTSSAEWIAEAPSAVTRFGTQVLPLANFGRVAFSGATATASGHTGTVSDANWSAERVNLVSSDAGYGGGPGPRFASFATGEATTFSLRQSGSAFSVAYSG